MANGYEIRHSLLIQAQTMLMEEWRTRCDSVKFNAGLSQTSIKECPELPSSAEIKQLAEDLYEFVQRK